METKVKDLFLDLLFIVLAIAVSLFIVEFVGQRTIVCGSSMESTLSDKDNLIVDKISYRFSDPERFDVIVFPYSEDRNYIKRVIGLPGETVRIDEDGGIYINGDLIEETYGKEIIKTPGIAEDPIVLGEDEYFVLGDNRNNSCDSRMQDVGNIKKDKIIGKAFVRVKPFKKIGFVR